MAARTGHCEHCGWPDSQPFETLSRHRTSEGVVTYTRCACGSVRMRLSPITFAPARPVNHA
ncbi:hypothetical protein [Nocardia crassostreae]|uniref:hypothetical protein n=1 Tax=Nocardia crassostreae TaxID=53428 RepID=UPI00082BAEE2|nr:hypothetical protein [Nocardia crassostreae]